MVQYARSCLRILCQILVWECRTPRRLAAELVPSRGGELNPGEAGVSSPGIKAALLAAGVGARD